MTFEQFSRYVESCGPAVLFVIVFIENLSIPGFPGGAAMPMVGVFARLGFFGLLKGYGWAMTSATAGMAASYLAAAHFHDWFERRLQKRERSAEAYARFNAYAEKHGLKAVALARLIPVVRAVTSPVCGVLGLPFVPYLLWSVAGTSVFCAAAVCLGYFVTHLFM